MTPATYLSEFYTHDFHQLFSRGAFLEGKRYGLCPITLNRLLQPQRWRQINDPFALLASLYAYNTIDRNLPNGPGRQEWKVHSPPFGDIVGCEHCSDEFSKPIEIILYLLGRDDLNSPRLQLLRQFDWLPLLRQYCGYIYTEQLPLLTGECFPMEDFNAFFSDLTLLLDAEPATIDPLQDAEVLKLSINTDQAKSEPKLQLAEDSSTLWPSPSVSAAATIEAPSSFNWPLTAPSSAVRMKLRCKSVPGEAS